MSTPFPQLRKDPIVDRWVLIAPERAARPTEVEDPGHLAHHAVCPFCEGHEHETPHEVLALRDPGGRPDTLGWRVRVVPNRFPAVRRAAGPEPNDDPLFPLRPGYGVHEVVIECPRHEPSLVALPEGHVRDVFGVYRDRLAGLRADPRLAYVQVFKNHGAAAGASVEHAHSQILALGRVPRTVQDELDGAAAYHRKYGRCVFCDLLARELAAGERVVLAGEHCVAVAAFAGRFPYETWVLPRRHAAHYDRLTAAELADLAAVVRAVLRRLGAVERDVPYNYLLHTAPAAAAELPHYHWHWEILPRLTGIAGFELAGGYFLNPLPPEEAATKLRNGTADARR
jgi:UDPglucose--hexose-1-phosphate uridylyltransferase